MLDLAFLDLVDDGDYNHGSYVKEQLDNHPAERLSGITASFSIHIEPRRFLYSDKVAHPFERFVAAEANIRYDVFRRYRYSRPVHFEELVYFFYGRESSIPTVTAVGIVEPDQATTGIRVVHALWEISNSFLVL